MSELQAIFQARRLRAEQGTDSAVAGNGGERGEGVRPVTVVTSAPSDGDSSGGAAMATIPPSASSSPSYASNYVATSNYTATGAQRNKMMLTTPSYLPPQHKKMTAINAPTTPRSPLRETQRSRATDDGIEVSPSAEGREALRLEEGPPQMPPPESPGRQADVVRNAGYRAAGGAVGINKNDNADVYDALMGGGGSRVLNRNNNANNYGAQHGHRALNYGGNYGGATNYGRNNATQNTQDPGVGGGGGGAQDPRAGAGAGDTTWQQRRRDRFGVRHPSDEGLEREAKIAQNPGEAADDGVGQEEPKNELQKKLMARRFKVSAGGVDNNENNVVEQKPKSPRVAMKWNGATMSYEPVIKTDGDDGNDNNEKNISNDSDRDCGATPEKKTHQADAGVRQSVTAMYQSKTSSTPRAAWAGNSPVMPSSGNASAVPPLPRTPSRTPFFKRTAPSANSGTVVVGPGTIGQGQPSSSLQSARSQFQQREQQQQAQRPPQPMSSLQSTTRQYGGGRPNNNQFNDQPPTPTTPATTQQAPTTSRASDDSSVDPSLRPSRSNASTVPVDNTSSPRPRAASTPRIGGRPQGGTTEFSRTVGGRASSRGRTREDERETGNKPPSNMLSLMARKYKEERDQAEHHKEGDGQQQDALRNEEKESSLSYMARRYRDQSKESQEEEGEPSDEHEKQGMEDQPNRQSELTPQQLWQQRRLRQQQHPQSQATYYRPKTSSAAGASTTSSRNDPASGGGSSSLNRWLQNNSSNDDAAAPRPYGSAFCRSGGPPPSPGCASARALPVSTVSRGAAGVGSIGSSSVGGGSVGGGSIDGDAGSDAGSNLDSPGGSDFGSTAGASGSDGSAVAIRSHVGSNAAWSAAGSGAGSGAAWSAAASSAAEEGNVPEFMKMRLRSTQKKTPPNVAASVCPAEGDEHDNEEDDVVSGVVSKVVSDAVAWPDMTPPQSKEEEESPQIAPQSPHMAIQSKVAARTTARPMTMIQQQSRAVPGSVRRRWQPPSGGGGGGKKPAARPFASAFPITTKSHDEEDSEDDDDDDEEEPSHPRERSNPAATTQPRTPGNVRGRWQPNAATPGSAKSKASSAGSAHSYGGRGSVAPSQASTPASEEDDARQPPRQQQPPTTPRQLTQPPYRPTTYIRGRWQPPSSVAKKSAATTPSSPKPEPSATSPVAGRTTPPASPSRTYREQVLKLSPRTRGGIANRHTYLHAAYSSNSKPSNAQNNAGAEAHQHSDDADAAGGRRQEETVGSLGDERVSPSNQQYQHGGGSRDGVLQQQENALNPPTGPGRVADRYPFGQQNSQNMQPKSPSGRGPPSPRVANSQFHLAAAKAQSELKPTIRRKFPWEVEKMQTSPAGPAPHRDKQPWEMEEEDERTPMKIHDGSGGTDASSPESSASPPDPPLDNEIDFNDTTIDMDARRPYQEDIPPANYDTAVLAARNAIDLSNSNRSRTSRRRSPRSGDGVSPRSAPRFDDLPVNNTNGMEPEEELYMARDPSLNEDLLARDPSEMIPPFSHSRLRYPSLNEDDLVARDPSLVDMGASPESSPTSSLANQEQHGSDGIGEGDGLAPRGFASARSFPVAAGDDLLDPPPGDTSGGPNTAYPAPDNNVDFFQHDVFGGYGVSDYSGEGPEATQQQQQSEAIDFFDSSFMNSAEDRPLEPRYEQSADITNPSDEVLFDAFGSPDRPPVESHYEQPLSTHEGVVFDAFGSSDQPPHQPSDGPLESHYEEPTSSNEDVIGFDAFGSAEEPPPGPHGEHTSDNDENDDFYGNRSNVFDSVNAFASKDAFGRAETTANEGSTYSDPFDPFSTGVFSYQHNDPVADRRPLDAPPASGDDAGSSPEERENYEPHHHDDKVEEGNRRAPDAPEGEAAVTHDGRGVDSGGEDGGRLEDEVFAAKKSGGPISQPVFGENNMDGNYSSPPSVEEEDTLPASTPPRTPISPPATPCTPVSLTLPRTLQSAPRQGAEQEESRQEFIDPELSRISQSSSYGAQSVEGSGDRDGLHPSDEYTEDLFRLTLRGNDSAARPMPQSPPQMRRRHVPVVERDEYAEDDIDGEFELDVANFAEREVDASMGDVEDDKAVLQSPPQRRMEQKRTAMPWEPRQATPTHYTPSEGKHPVDTREQLHQDSLASFRVRQLELQLGSPEDVRIANPVQNPLSGNLIVCRYDGKGNFSVEEMDVSDRQSPTAVMSAALLTGELNAKLARCSASVRSRGRDLMMAGVSSVLSLAAGVHRVQGRSRVRVAALTEVLVASGRDGGVRKARVVAVWRWGYLPSGGTALASLQSVLTTDGIVDSEARGRYDSNTLQVADGLLFLGGSGGGPRAAVYVAKPAVRDGWTCVPIPDTSAQKVSALAVADDASPHLAVGLSNGSAVVLTYELAARTNRLNRMQPANKNSLLLRPLCQLWEETDVAESCGDDDCLWPAERFFSTAYRGATTTSAAVPLRGSNGKDDMGGGGCTSLAWIHQSSSGISYLPLLAAAFASGIAVYHVAAAAPQQQDQQRTIVIKPLAMTKFLTTSEVSEMDAFLAPSLSINWFRGPRPQIAWHDLGPRSPPCLSLLFEHEKRSYQRDDKKLLSNSLVRRLCLLAVDVPWYGSVEITEGMPNHRPLGVICQKELDAGDASSSIIGNTSGTNGAVICCNSLGHLLVCEPINVVSSALTAAVFHQEGPVMADGYFSSLACPVTSASLGLDSNGCVYLGGGGGGCSKSSPTTTSEVNYRDAVLIVYSVTSCDSTEEDESQADDQTDHKKEIMMPSQRHWLLISTAGDDVKKLTLPAERMDAVDGEQSSGGATTDVLFELTCGENSVSGLVPHRVVKEEGPEARRVAVLFSSGFFGGNYVEGGDSVPSRSRVRTQARLSQNAVAYAILDMDTSMVLNGGSISSSFQLRRGRDVAFLPPSLPAETDGEFHCSSLLVLDPDGDSLSVTTVISSSVLREGENERVVESIQKCSLQYEGVEGRRVFALTNDRGSLTTPPEILLAGYSRVVERPCLLLTKHKLERDGMSNQLTLVEDTGLGHRLWLREGEEVLSTAELPIGPNNNGGALRRRANIAVASQYRVMILSAEGSLSIVAELDARLTCASLSPLGSHCVAFCASGDGRTSRVMYLSTLESGEEGSRGVLATLPSPPSSARHVRPLLVSVRPDRLVYFDRPLSGLRIVAATDGQEEEENKHGFETPLPRTRPLFLLEPLVANALCQDGASGANAAADGGVQRSLRQVVERFGRKDSAFPHGDDQGAGMAGAGVTMRVYGMLARRGCHDAALILLSGTLLGDSISRPKLLPPWIPMRLKTTIAPATTGGGTQSMMQVLSCGDGDLAEILRRSSNHHQCDQSAVIFPGPLDPSSVLAEELALSALCGSASSSAAASDIVKLLDFAGRESSESILGRLALSLGMSPSTNRTLSDSQKLLEQIVNAATYNDVAGNNSATSINKCAQLCSGVALKLMHQNNGALLGNDVAGSSLNVSQLAPTVQAIREGDRVRSATLGNEIIETTLGSHNTGDSSHSINHGAAWNQSINKNKHVWSAGPSGKKESLLELDRFEDWLGRCRPTVLGKEGVAMATDTGERTLAEILSAAARDEDEGEDGSNSVDTESADGQRKNWVEGVGEGRLDEDNLSLYLRFSEGAEEDVDWKADGFVDLTKHSIPARVYGSDLASVEATTSSVDEGEEGKVRLLYDLVYPDGAPREQATGVVVEALRGGGLDVGMLHDDARLAASRRRCTVEMWYKLPRAHLMTDEIVLARRSLFYEDNDDASKLCMPDEKHNTLWELAVLPTGLLELRTGAGSVATSAMYIAEGNGDNDGSDARNGLVLWEREDGGGGWNHVCLVFSSQSHSSIMESSASILMNGVVVVSSATISVNPFGSEVENQDLNRDDIEDAMEKTVLIFGIGPPIGFRMTELRVWACQRSVEDVRLMMYEYLRDAEIKKKLKVNIRRGAKKSIGGGGRRGGGLLPPPVTYKRSLVLAPPLTARSSPVKRSVSATDANNELEDVKNTDFMLSFANFGEDVVAEEAQVLTKQNNIVDPGLYSIEAKDAPGFATSEDGADEKGQTLIGAINYNDSNSASAEGSTRSRNSQENGGEEVELSKDMDEQTFDPPKDVVKAEAIPRFCAEEAQMLNRAESDNSDPQNEQIWTDPVKAKDTTMAANDDSDNPEETPILASATEGESPRGKEEARHVSFVVVLSDLLSTNMRKSAAAAIVRGPPAARHFGGNRGGLAYHEGNFGSKCNGVSPIAICGADKSVVWFSDRDPPGRTYPIGASGAVLSDIVDEDGSEYMCCFLAREKRMVVFELSRKTVAVELQMKTKLNFWRYLPPPSHGSALAFVLITPVGGFHWKPLDESPRPRQVWRRGPELESKKILSYEEGGSNGRTGADARSTVALVIASSATPKSTTVEAHCIAMNDQSSQFCMSNVVLGAALCRPPASPSYYLPFVVTISKDVTYRLVLDVEDLWEESDALVRGIIGSTILDMGGADFVDDDSSYPPPSMSMGPLPEALICCHDDFIVAVIRRKGLVFAFDFSGGDLVLVGKSGLSGYVVDASVRSGDADGDVELVMLLCEGDNPNDGRIATMTISRAE